MTKKAFFICGTDTSVGKTTITGALAAFLCQKRKTVGVFKPVETGCQKKDGKIQRPDSQWLKQMAQSKLELDTINPYYFEEPLAPKVASQREGIVIELEKIKNSFNEIYQKHEITFVEGAGGLLVPITDQKTNLDLIQYLDLQVILVSRLELGTINHTLLTYQKLIESKIDVVGVVLNQTQPKKDVAGFTNPAVLQKWQIPLLGEFGYLENKDINNQIAQIKKIDWGSIFGVA